MKKNRMPIYKSISFIRLIPQAFILILIYEIFRNIEVPNYTILSIVAFIMLSIYLKIIIPRSHRKGIFFIKKNNYASALLCFHLSYQFFHRYEWLDKYRSLFLLSASKLSYKEMALANMGFCYLRMDKKKDARKIYQRLLTEFPHNQQAKEALNALNSK